MLGSGAGKWIVPWSSRRARPEGVWRMEGRGFVGVDVELEEGLETRRGIVGIFGGWGGEHPD